MKINSHYASHLPLLIKTLLITTGDVLELGIGINSTPIFHWLCVPHKRHVYSYEINPKYYATFEQFKDEYHHIELVENWDAAQIERPWDVALVDHEPARRRKVEIKRLADYTKYIVVHDSDWRSEKYYGYKEIFPLFKYRYDFCFRRPHTAILSNLIDLKDFEAC